MARRGVHHVRAESRSTDMDTGRMRSAMAIIVGVIMGSAYTMKGILLMYLYARAAAPSWPANALQDWA